MLFKHRAGDLPSGSGDPRGRNEPDLFGKRSARRTSVSPESVLEEKLYQSWESLIWKVIGVDCEFFLEKELFNVDKHCDRSETVIGILSSSNGQTLRGWIG